MTISIRMTIYDLGLIRDIIRNIDFSAAWINATKEQRVAYSLIQGVLKKIRKKIIDKEGTSTTKYFKMKLSYPDAYAVYYSLLFGLKNMDIDPYDYYSETTLQKIVNQLDQQLL